MVERIEDEGWLLCKDLSSDAIIVGSAFAIRRALSILLSR